MSFKSFGILLLILIAAGAAGAFYVVYQRNQAEQNAAQQLYRAQALLQEEAHEKAIGVLTDLMRQYPDFSNMSRAVFDLGQAYVATNPAQALETLETYLQQYPEGAMRLEAHQICGQLALERGKTEQAASHFDVLQSARLSKYRNVGRLGEAAVLEAQGEFQEAREIYYAIIEEHGESSEEAVEAVENLSRLNTRLFLSPRVTEFSQRYRIQSGDNLISIASRFDTTVYLLKAINGIEDHHTLRAGRGITVPKPGGVKIKVDKPACRLYVYSKMEGTEGKLLKAYPVGVAEYTERTPPGIYVISIKQIDPTWYKPDGGVLPPGHPENALGTRWMGFSRDGRKTSLGIHGTNAPETIGSESSAGCIRMYNEDAEELFMIAREGTEVEIVE